ncbi:hypothetical protein [Lacisediminimonas sp.]|uniref:hypothetical protein n=1 Tax=Lacisediminimonas sp. TaxID=3060582 RepID=UPI00272A220F|nr:hypothetical protein [Lacisediminimonas sp.]
MSKTILKALPFHARSEAFRVLGHYIWCGAKLPPPTHMPIRRQQKFPHTQFLAGAAIVLKRLVCSFFHCDKFPATAGC